MEEQEKPKEEKYFHYENIGKSLITTITGCLMMGVGVGSIVLSQFISLPLLNIWVMSGVAVAGLLLLFAKDKLIENVIIITKNKFGS